MNSNQNFPSLHINRQPWISAPSMPLAKIGIALVLIAAIAAGVYVFVKRKKE